MTNDDYIRSMFNEAKRLTDLMNSELRSINSRYDGDNRYRYELESAMGALASPDWNKDDNPLLAEQWARMASRRAFDRSVSEAEQMALALEGMAALFRERATQAKAWGDEQAEG